MKPTRYITLFSLVCMFLMGVTPLFAEFVTIGGNGDLSLNRPFCGT